MRRFSAYVRRSSASLLAILLLATGVILPVAPAMAANEGISTVADKTVTMGETVAITDLEITGDGNDAITLSIKANHGEFNFGTEDANVTGAGTGYVTVDGLRDDVNSTLATLTYTPTGLGADTIEVNLGSNVDNVIIDPIGGHAYTIVDDFLTWDDASAAAAQLQYGGVQGYLANVTSEEEDSFIVEHLQGNGWIGASDAGNEGDWIWVAGPEAGTQFWSGGSVINGGHAVDELYSNWNWNEPNNSGNEDCAEYIVGQGWNDLNCDSETRNYVVEFGAADLPDLITEQFTITTNANVIQVSTCEQLFALTEDNRYDEISLTSDIDCEGQTVEPLFRDANFRGELSGNGYTIKNFVIDEPEEVYIALIGEANDATVRNLNLENIQVNGGYDTGALIGYAYGTLNLENVHARNVNITVEGWWGSGYTGGLVGEVDISEGESANLSNLSFEGTISAANGTDIGGLVGMFESAGETTIEQVYANAQITLSGYGNDIGGLFGELEADGYGSDASVTLRNAYSWSTIALTNPEEDYYDNVGGIIGKLDSEEEGHDADLLLQNTYARGSVQGTYSVGGLIGRVDPSYSGAYTIENSFAMGNVEAFDENGLSGAIIGESGDEEPEYLSLSNMYFDQTRTQQEDCVGDAVEISGCTAVNTTGDQPHYFINNISNAPLNTWDFNNIWIANQNVPPTFSPVLDSDNDSIIDSIEDAAPNGGDANNDGIADSVQSNVASLIDPVTGKYAVLIVSEECSITAVSIAAESANHTQDTDYEYPAGLMDFTIDCGIDGFTADITQYYYGVSGDFVVRKYNPNTQTYSVIEQATTSDQTIAGQQIKVASYQVTDGGELDIDGEENGIIVDPVGLAAPVTPGQGSGTGDLANTGQSIILYALIAALLITTGLLFLATQRTRHTE